ncbi:MAG: hypothetical protein CSA45_06050 [Gammaproteobacteria bacterium]|nr:MAG: hypothetical protein CSA45_06050 [Gammaproteobacteria bacterium]
MKALFPHLWQLYLHTLPYQAGEEEQPLVDYIADNLDAICEELNTVRQDFVDFVRNKNKA